MLTCCSALATGFPWNYSTTTFSDYFLLTVGFFLKPPPLNVFKSQVSFVLKCCRVKVENIALRLKKEKTHTTQFYFLKSLFLSHCIWEWEQKRGLTQFWILLRCFSRFLFNIQSLYKVVCLPILPWQLYAANTMKLMTHRQRFRTGGRQNFQRSQPMKEVRMSMDL